MGWGSDPRRSTWVPLLNLSGVDKNVLWPKGDILVGRSKKGHSGVCRQFSELPKSNGRTPKVGCLNTRDPNSYLEVGRHQYGLCSRFTSNSKVMLPYVGLWIDWLSSPTLFSSILHIWWRIMQESSYIRLCAAMAFRYPSYQIRTHNSHLYFGGCCTKG